MRRRPCPCAHQTRFWLILSAAPPAPASTIGVSNYNETKLAEVLEIARIKPAVNQIKYHAYNVGEQAATLALCAEHGIVVEAYSALTPITTLPGASPHPE